MVVTANAEDVERVYKFNFHSSTIAEAINEISKITDTPTVFSYDTLKGLRAKEVKGSFTREQALEHLLRGTRLTATMTSQGVLVVVTDDANNKAEETELLPSKKGLLYSVAASVLGLSTPSYAQETEVTEKEVDAVFTLDTVLVTSRKREESLVDTPIAVTAVSGGLLDELGATDLTDIASIAPNVSFTTTGTVSGSTSAAVIYIRGIGQNDYVPVVDPGVGVYVDDVYYGRTVGSVLDLVDINRVEVLRGPQGTLFGRNSIGGAISIVTHDPTEDSSGKLKVLVGDQGRKEGFFTQNLEFTDTLSANINFMRRLRDGTVTRVNVPNSEKLGNENSTGFRTKIAWEPSDKFRFVLTGDYIQEREESAPEVNAFYQESFTLPGAWNGFNGFAAFAPGATSSGCVAGDDSVGTDCYNNSQQLGPFRTGETSLSQNDIDAWGISAAATYDINDILTGRLIVGHRNLEAYFARQVDGTSFNLFENRDAFLAEQTSVDARLNLGLDRLNMVAGAFYFTEDSDNQLDFSGVLEGTLYPIHFGGVTSNENYAFYSEASFDLTDRFQLTGGIRYTSEEKAATPNAFGYPGCSIETLPTAPSDACDSTLAPVTIPLRTTSDYLVPNVEQSISFEEVTWRVAASYSFTDTINMYASASTGFKSGGFEWRVTNTNFRANAIAEAEAEGMTNAEAIAFVETNGALPSFDPETVLTYELGLKAEFPEQGLRINTAIFDSEYEDQIVAANAGGIATFQTNAAQSSIQGAEVEVEVQWVPTDNILINAAYGYLDAKYEELTPGAIAAGLSLDDKFVLAPEHTANFGISYAIPTSYALITPRLDVVYKSSQEFEASNSVYTRDEGYTALNASLKFAPDARDWVITAGVQNLTDELYKVGGDSNTAIGYENVIFARPRSVFLSLDYSW